MSNETISFIKNKLRLNKLHTVCEEAKCPNLGECFTKGTATFMIMGDICTRRCTFCDVAFGRPLELDIEEPAKIAQAVFDMKLNYVVITSVDRDDLRDGGANHFANCIKEIRKVDSNIKIEILVPDFRGRDKVAIEILSNTQPDLFNHNIETVQRIYKNIKIGGDYVESLNLLKNYKLANPNIKTKSGLMVGIGESEKEVIDTLIDLKNHQVDMITIGQYLSPSNFHTGVDRYVALDEFLYYKDYGEKELGFLNVESGPLVRSSYFAEKQQQNDKKSI